MKPFSCRSTEISERIFNYRLSWARRVVENAFGILSAKFMVFRAPIALKLSTTRSIVLACTCLHNFLLERQMEKDDSAETATQLCLITMTWKQIPQMSLEHCGHYHTCLAD